MRHRACRDRKCTVENELNSKAANLGRNNILGYSCVRIGMCVQVPLIATTIGTGPLPTSPESADHLAKPAGGAAVKAPGSQLQDSGSSTFDSNSRDAFGTLAASGLEFIKDQARDRSYHWFLKALRRYTIQVQGGFVETVVRKDVCLVPSDPLYVTRSIRTGANFRNGLSRRQAFPITLVLSLLCNLLR